MKVERFQKLYIQYIEKIEYKLLNLQTDNKTDLFDIVQAYTSMKEMIKKENGKNINLPNYVLFCHMIDNYNLILTESEMEEIKNAIIEDEKMLKHG